MNSDQVKGIARMLFGKVQEEVGNVIGSPKQVIMGIAKQVTGRAQKGRGDVKVTIKGYRQRHPEEGFSS